MPFFAGPVGAVNLHYSDRYDDVSYNNVLVSACADAGIAAFTRRWSECKGNGGCNGRQSVKMMDAGYLTVKPLESGYCPGEDGTGEEVRSICGSDGY